VKFATAETVRDTERKARKLEMGAYPGGREKVRFWAEQLWRPCWEDVLGQDSSTSALLIF
jgi:hypothetical protein